MDDVTNTHAAATEQPAVRVRVVGHHEQTMNKAEVVFVPCPDSNRSRSKIRPWSSCRRAAVIKATTATAQLNYVDGPINIYHDHLVVDQEGRPQKEVVIEMERRVAAVWLSVTDCRDGRALPTAVVQLLDGDDVAHVFDAPGSHDVAAVTSVTKTYSLQLHLRGYVLHGPTTVTLERGKRVDLLVTARRTDINVVCRELRSGRRIDDVISLVNEANGGGGDTVDTDRSYRIVESGRFSQVTNYKVHSPKALRKSTAPLEAWSIWNLSKVPCLWPRLEAVWGWLALDQPSEKA